MEKGSGASATATINDNGKITGITLISGSGYESAPDVIITGGGGTGANAFATINAVGEVTGISIGDGGSGYTGIPIVTIIGGKGATATATATIKGKMDRIRVDSRGSGYTSQPTVTIGSPTALPNPLADIYIKQNGKIKGSGNIVNNNIIIDNNDKTNGIRDGVNVTNDNGIILSNFVTNANEIKYDFNLNNDFTLNSGKTLTINNGKILNVNSTLTNNGTITADSNSTINVNSTLTNNNGTITTNAGCKIFDFNNNINGTNVQVDENSIGIILTNNRTDSIIRTNNYNFINDFTLKSGNTLTINNNKTTLDNTFINNGIIVNSAVLEVNSAVLESNNIFINKNKINLNSGSKLAIKNGSFINDANAKFIDYNQNVNGIENPKTISNSGTIITNDLSNSIVRHNIDLENDFILLPSNELTIDSGKTLTVGTNGKLIDYGKINGVGGTLTNNGTAITNFLPDSHVRHNVTLTDLFGLESVNTLTIDSGKTLTVGTNGKLIDYGQISGGGTLTNNGTAITNFLTDSHVRHNVTLTHDISFNAEKILTIASDKTLTIDSGKTLKVGTNGKLIDYGSISADNTTALQIDDSATRITNFLPVSRVRHNVILTDLFTLENLVGRVQSESLFNSLNANITATGGWRNNALATTTSGSGSGAVLTIVTNTAGVKLQAMVNLSTNTTNATASTTTNNVQIASTTGTGDTGAGGAEFTVVTDGDGVVTSATATVAGDGYNVGDTLTLAVPGASTNLVITLVAADMATTPNAVSSVTVINTGTGYVDGDTITVDAGDILGATDDLVFTLDADDIKSNTLTIDSDEKLTVGTNGKLIDYGTISGNDGTLINNGTAITNFLLESYVRHYVRLTDDFALTAGNTLTIADGKQLTIASGKKLTIGDNAKLLDSGTISGQLVVKDTSTYITGSKSACHVRHNVTLKYSFSLWRYYKLTIHRNKTLTIDSYFENDGILLDYGKISGGGTLANHGTAITNFLTDSHFVTM